MGTNIWNGKVLIHDVVFARIFIVVCVFLTMMEVHTVYIATKMQDFVELLEKIISQSSFSMTISTDDRI